jgi:hypothetical protein
MMHDVSPNRSGALLGDALAAVETVERRLFAGAEPGLFRVDGRVAVRHGEPVAGGLDLERLADPLVRTVAEPGAETISAASDCAVVVVGKLASADLRKARGYLVADGLGVTLKVWRAVEGQISLGGQERTIRRELVEMPGFPAPPVLGDGRIGATDYVLEPAVYGRHPWSAQARVDAALDLVPALAGAWRRWGPIDASLEHVFDDGVLKRLRRVLADPTLRWDATWGSRRRLLLELWRLVRRSRDLPCAPAHGDIVATNIIREPSGRHVLIDWEHGRRMPVAFDIGSCC